jgi:hypothetical protein
MNNNKVASPKGRDVKIKGGLCMGKAVKSKKIEKMSLAWCESMRGRKDEEGMR